MVELEVFENLVRNRICQEIFTRLARFTDMHGLIRTNASCNGLQLFSAFQWLCLTLWVPISSFVGERFQCLVLPPTESASEGSLLD